MTKRFATASHASPGLASKDSNSQIREQFGACTTAGHAPPATAGHASPASSLNEDAHQDVATKDF
eukprot:10501295-Karenia_brevis.AAC.1